MSLPAVPPSRLCFACIACAERPHFISLVSRDSRMNPLIYLDIPTITLYIRMRLLLLTTPEKYNHTSVFISIPQCPKSLLNKPYVESVMAEGPLKGKGKQSDEQCHDHQHFLVLLKCFDIIPKHIRSGSTEVDCVGFGMSQHFSIFHHHFSVGDTPEQICIK